MLETFVTFIVNTIGDLGYFGIYVMMFLESSFIPFPSEIVMIPAGYLAYQGEMSMILAIVCGILGSLTGAIFNYFLAIRYGRGFLIKYGNYLFIDEVKMQKMENFFKSHGHISTFSGRLIPGVRQYISFPAGLAKMNLVEFSIFTTLGAGIWVIILAYLGYFLGDQEELIKEYTHEAVIYTLIVISIIVFIYTYYHRIKKK